MDKNCQTIAVTLRLRFVAKVKIVSMEDCGIPTPTNLASSNLSRIYDQTEIHGQTCCQYMLEVHILYDQTQIHGRT